jgi:probable phosphoglycerate mutase
MSAGAGSAEATRIVAVRHGETVWNAEMRMQGQLDTALSAHGRWQAARAGEALAGEGIEAIVASDLSRAFNTAQAIAAVVGLPIAIDAGLRERCFGEFEGHTYAEIDARWPIEAARWRRHDPDFGPIGGETLVDFFARAVAALTRIAAAHRGRTICIVTHGGVLDCLYRVAAGVDLGAARTWELGNASINRVLFTGEGFTLVGWGDTGHLDGATLDDASEVEGAAAATPRRAAS